MAETTTRKRPWIGKREEPEGAGILKKKLILPASLAEICIDLPVPPSVNELFLNNKGKGKGRIKTPAYRAWIAEATFDVRRQVKTRIEGAYLIHYRINRECTGADIWNLEKAIPDLLQEEGVVKNDKYSEGGSIYWSDQPKEVRVTIQAAERGERIGD